MNNLTIDTNNFLEELEHETQRILDFWIYNTIDEDNGGFIGAMDSYGKSLGNADKGVILNTRILWSFSRAANFHKGDIYSKLADRAFSYLMNHFIDAKNGGVFWMLDSSGKPINKRKQIYAQAFCIYGFSEYYKYSNNNEALIMALSLFKNIEGCAYIEESEGYMEAFSREWTSISDVRLSVKDLNAPLTTNTHLHILEAYTTLFEITTDEHVKVAIRGLLRLFLDKIFDSNGHMKLFFSLEWKSLSNEISFGHDIEAVWLMVLAARTIQDESLVLETEGLLLRVANVFIREALDKDYGVFNTRNAENGKLDTDKHWWCQAEAVVGLLYAWQISGKKNYLENSIKIWGFIKDHILDKTNGEWFFRVNRKGVPYHAEHKVGPWKCPYHNLRALFEARSLFASHSDIIS